jgi:hypothetical protein
MVESTRAAASAASVAGTPAAARAFSIADAVVASITRSPTSGVCHSRAAGCHS